MDKIKGKHVGLMFAVALVTVFAYDYITTKINSSKTATPASTATPPAASA